MAASQEDVGGTPASHCDGGHGQQDRGGEGTRKDKEEEVDNPVKQSGLCALGRAKAGLAQAELPASRKAVRKDASSPPSSGHLSTCHCFYGTGCPLHGGSSKDTGLDTLG